MLRCLVHKSKFLGYRNMVIMTNDYITSIPELNKPHVYIKDKAKVNLIINELVNGGQSKLQVILDFDRTITKQHDDGVPQVSSFAIFEKCPSLPDTYKMVVEALNMKYKPIEFDPKIPSAEKKKHMEDWWRLSKQNLAGLSVSYKEIEEVVRELKPTLRDCCIELFDLLKKNEIPILVFSAGLGQTVIAVLNYYNILHSNVKVVANFLKYNDQGIIQGFQDETIINVFNKNESVLSGTEYYEKLHDRVNAIVVGDSIGDANMFSGEQTGCNVLKIGFLYDHAEDNLEGYMKHFDIVLVDDQTMHVIHAILNHIF
nr:7-methylguanosine phosphate-specific 5'-nucleotidase [Onthophagus taurus]